MLCKCGCGREISKEGNKYIRGHIWKGKNRPPFSKEWREKLSEVNKGKCSLTPDGRKRKSEYMKNGGSKHARSFPTMGFKNYDEWFKNGGMNYMHKNIKNPSGEELKLRKMIKELYSTSEHTYKILNYDVDVVLVEHKIAIEYDGHFHFNSEENIEYHKRRQQEIEQEGWKFLRYSMFDEFPTKKQVEDDIKNLLKDKENVCGVD